MYKKGTFSGSEKGHTSFLLLKKEEIGHSPFFVIPEIIIFFS